MKPHARAMSLLFGLVAATSLTPAGAAEGLPMSDRWRIEVDHDAKSDGTILFRVTPDGAAPFDVPVIVPAGHHENHVARDIQSSLSAALDRRTYEVKMDDGEDVVVKRMGGPTFNLKLIDSNVKNVRIEVEKK